MDRETRLLTEKFQAYKSLLSAESERGCIIVAAALFDDLLLTTLVGRLVPSLESRDELFDSLHAPLRSFSAKIDLAYRVGTIGPKMRASLHVLRKLRNDFAHLSEPIDFATQSVRDRIWDLLSRNRHLLEDLWADIRPDLEQTFPGVFPPSSNDDTLKDLVGVAGHQFSFVLWASAAAGALAVWGLEEDRLKPKAVAT